MTEHNDDKTSLIDEILTQARDLTPDEDTTRQAMSNIERRLAAETNPPVSPPQKASLHGKPRVAKYVTWMTLAAAASIVITLLSAHSFHKDASPRAALYAQALSALRNAHTLHIKEYRAPHDGSGLRLDQEMWHERDGGIRCDSAAFSDIRGPTRRVDTSEVQWVLDLQSKVAIRRTPYGGKDRSEKLFKCYVEGGEYLPHLKAATPLPQGNRTIRGAACRLFVADRPYVWGVKGQTYSKPGKVHLWLDDRNAVHLAEYSRLEDDRWITYSRTEVEFDAPIPADTFSTDPPADYEVIDPAQVLSDMFDLGKADAQKEVDGMIVAFHGTRRIDDRTIVTVISQRQTNTLRQALVMARDGGEDKLEPRFRRLLDMDYPAYPPGEFTLLETSPRTKAILLATLEEEAMEVHWYVLRAADGRIGNTVDVVYRVYDKYRGGRQLPGIPDSEPTTEHLRLADKPIAEPAEMADAVYGQLGRLARFRPQWIACRFGDPLLPPGSEDASCGELARAEEYGRLRIKQSQFRNAVARYLGTDSRPAGR